MVRALHSCHMQEGGCVYVHAQLCLTYCNIMDCSLPGSSDHGNFQARILEQVTISYSRGSSQPRDQTHICCRFFTNVPPAMPQEGWVKSIKNPWRTVSLHIVSEVKLLSCIQFFATPWSAASQASLSMGFSRQEYWSGLPFPSPRDLPDSGIEPRSPMLQADALPSKPPLQTLGTKC